MASKYQLKKAKDGQFYFNLLAANGQVILTSEMYKAKASADNGIDSVRKNGPLPERYDRRINKGGKDYFVLKAANHQVIGTSEAYNSKASMENGIKSVMKNAPGAPVDDQTG